MLVFPVASSEVESVSGSHRATVPKLTASTERARHVLVLERRRLSVPSISCFPGSSHCLFCPRVRPARAAFASGMIRVSLPRLKEVLEVTRPPHEPAGTSRSSSPEPLFYLR
jgi:hypothetical protein